MADNTLQFQWIVTVKGNLEGLFLHDADVFIAGDLLWYPVEGHPEICTAPDTLAAFGRPKGYRGSYKQWEEGGVAPHTVFEILSPNNTTPEMDRKFEFYDRYRVEEYYLYDPDHPQLWGWRRVRGRLRPIRNMDGWVSPRLGIRFDMSGDELVIYHPDGRRFLTFEELMEHQREAERKAEQERLAREKAERRATRERRAREKAEQQAEQERRDKEEAERRAEQLAEQLRKLGIDPQA
jgi:Uma2 family endonuclease